MICSMRMQGLRTGLALVFTLCGLVHSRADYDPEMLIIKDASGNILKIFTVSELKENFPQHIYNTPTPWTTITQKILYRGPLMKDVLASAGIAGSASIKVTACNDFIARIHNDEIQKYAPLLAVETGCDSGDDSRGICREGQGFRPITMLEKGPIFIVWPYRDFPRDYFPARNAIWVFFPVIIQPDP